MTKKLVLLIVLAVLAVTLVLAGCRQEAPAPPAPPPVAEQPTQPEPPAQDDPFRVGVIFAIPNPRMGGGFDRAQMRGFDYLEANFGWEIHIADDVPLPQVNDVARTYLGQGFDMIIYSSSAMASPWYELAPEFPDRWMIMASQAPELPAGTDKAASFFLDFYIYGVMQGIVLGLLTETNEIGVVGGMPIPATGLMFSGVIEGVRAVNPDANVTINYVGDWVDVAMHREIAELLVVGGNVDSIFTLTGPGQMGIFEVAEAHGALVVGYAYDMWDMAPNAIATSVEMDMTYVFRFIAERVMDGTLRAGLFELGAEAMSIAEFRGSVDAELEAEILDTIARFQRGEISIPRVDHSATFMP